MASILTAIGLATPFLAAFAAFSHIMPWYQAVFAALLIEASMVVEAVALVRGRNWLAAIGLSISLVISATYNYIQAQTAGDGPNPNMLFALALGPLSTLTFQAMATGKELGNNERQVEVWEERRQEWLDQQRSKQERSEEKRMLASAPHHAVQDKAKRYICGQCGASLGGQPALAAHMRWKHSE